MANLPSTQTDNSKPEPTDYHETMVDWLEKGKTLPELASKLAKGDKKQAKHLRKKFQRTVQKDPLLAEAIYGRARGTMLTAVPGTVEAVRKRAQRGRMDAAKIVLEASGVHNPRVKHEHSGDIKVSLDIPRPKFEQDVIAEAEVVDD